MSLSEFETPGTRRRDHEEPRLRTRRSDYETASSADKDARMSRNARARGRSRWHKPRRWLLRSALAFAILCLLLVALLISAGAWLRHSMKAALPQVDGDLHVAGLGTAVTVSRDAQGVPSIQAAKLDDLLFAQGFVTAQDRLWQMDSLRRHEAGELAEILGSRLIEHDRTQRILQTRAAADRAISVLPADQLHQLESYAAGVNAFIGQNEDHLPVEFKLLHYKPAPWTPRDSLLVGLAMFQDLTTEFPTKMKREALMAHLPPYMAADLYPVGSWRDRPPSQPRPDLTTPKLSIEEIPLDDTQVQLHRPQNQPRMDPRTATPQEVLRVAAELPGQTCSECRAGSNSWAVAGRRSASGAPLVSNDMHLALSVPDIWYEAGLHVAATSGSAGLDAVGFTLPGTPFVLVGRNAHVAWGFTNLLADVQDVHIEHLRGSGSDSEYQKADGTWSPVAHSAEHIRVRGGHEITVDVQSTTAAIGGTEIVTPIISPLFPSEQRVLSLAWTAYDPANLTLPLLAVDTANDGPSLVVAFSSFGGPLLNLVYADTEHIGYHALGRIPVRGSMQRQKRPEATPSEELTGPIPKDEGDSGDADAPQASIREHNNGFAATLMDAAFRSTRGERGKPQTTAKRQPRHEKREVPTEVPPSTALVLSTSEVNDYTVGLPIANVPVDALDLAHKWVGYIPYNELPSAADPANGVLATANARVTPDNYPYSISNNWLAPYRAERIYKLLEKRNRLTPADMLAVQNDVHSEFDLVLAQRLAYALDHASAEALHGDGKRLHQAADILRQWRGEVTPDSSAAAIVTAFRGAIWPMLLVPQIAAHDRGKLASGKPDGKKPAAIRADEIAAMYQWGGQSVALELMVQYRPPRWLPQQYKSWDDLLTSAVVRGLHNEHAPSDIAKWRYSALYKIEISHPVFSLSPLFRRVLGVPTGTGAHESGGDASTIRAMGTHFGPSERFTADLANPDATLGNITTGESGNPASMWYLDQFPSWLAGTSFALPLHGNGTTHTLTLEP